MRTPQDLQSFSLSLMLTLYLPFLLFLVSGAPSYTPTEYILLDCGSPSNTTSEDGQHWEGDTTSKFSPSNLQQTSSSFTASGHHTSVTQVPYMTARIFHSQFTYTFPLSAGPKFIRLYFYPATYSDLHISDSFFSVTANSYTLLRNFSAFLTVSASDSQKGSLAKEFCINIWEDKQSLNLTFSPSPNSFAFVNGIEIVSMPDTLYVKDNNPIKLVNQQTEFTLDNNTALENLYRLNVGGQAIRSTGDTGMLRTWNEDNKYIYGKAIGKTPYRQSVKIQYTDETPEYTAPDIVYKTYRTMDRDPRVNLNYNLTWLFQIDSGFSYLVRLHFCETQLEVTRQNQRVFFIFINNQTAEEEADVIEWSGGTGIPVYRDYVVMVMAEPGGTKKKQDLWLELHPNIEDSPTYANAILNGVEIFKLNQSDGSLAGPNPDPAVLPKSPESYPNQLEKRKSKGFSPVPIVIGSVLGGVVAIFLLCFIIFRRVKKKNGNTVSKSLWVPLSYTASKSTKTNSTTLPSDLCRHFSLSELQSATSNFHDSSMIGVGGFGNVYKGYINIDGDSTLVAIKRLNPSSKQGANEFETEIQMLSQLRHLHLVSLIGYCDENGEMILVYDYMARGTLRDHLYKTKNPPLPWKQRLEICIGAARGLHYLHTGAKRMIIHRDVKSTNILLDERWVAKVSDFGLSKMGSGDDSQTHISTVVKGSIGYLDPEYYRRKQLTEKSDVYSFGVVLFEVLCGRPAMIPGLPREQVSLAHWGKYNSQLGTLGRIVDPNLVGQISPECLRKFGEIATSCVRDNGIERRAMGDVVWTLEFALQLQENADKMNGDDGIGVSQIRTNPSGTWASPRREVTTTDDVFSESDGRTMETKSSDTSGIISCEHDYKGRSESVFSEIMNPNGR